MNDVKLISSDKTELAAVSNEIVKHFDIKDLRETHHYLDMKIQQNSEKKIIRLSQIIYTQALLEQFSMMNAHLVSILMTSDFSNQNVIDDEDSNLFNSEKYRFAVKSLQFLTNYIKSDIFFITDYLAYVNSASIVAH